PLVRPPALENGMEAVAEAARDVAEAQRRPQKRSAQRSAAIVEETVLVGKREARRSCDIDARREDPAEAPLAFGRLQPLEQYLDAVARTQVARSEEHTSELQSRGHLVCRLLLEK